MSFEQGHLLPVLFLLSSDKDKADNNQQEAAFHCYSPHTIIFFQYYHYRNVKLIDYAIDLLMQ